MWQPPLRKQLRTCGLRPCIAFEKLFNLLMNFEWIGKRLHGSYPKRCKKKKSILRAITILSGVINWKYDRFRWLKLAKSKICYLFIHTDSFKFNPISFLCIWKWIKSGLWDVVSTIMRQVLQAVFFHNSSSYLPRTLNKMTDKDLDKNQSLGLAIDQLHLCPF